MVAMDTLDILQDVQAITFYSVWEPSVFVLNVLELCEAH